MQRRIALVAVATIAMTGCSNLNVSKEAQATGAGVVAGAVAGAQIGGVRGAIIGGVVGGVIGNRIGSYLDEQDKKKLAELESKSVLSGKTTSFVSSKSQSKVTITPQQSITERDPARELKLPAGIARHDIELSQTEPIRAYVDTPVYADISEKGSARTTIAKGSTISVAANVSKKKWSAVSEGNMIVGYVPNRYLDKDIEKQARKPIPKKLAQAEIAPTRVAAAPAASTAPQTIQEQVAPAPSSIQVARLCRVVSIKLEPSGGGAPVTEDRKYCNDPPPKWKLVGA